MSAVAIEFCSLYWPDMDPRIPEAQQKVFQHFDIAIRQDCIHVPHGTWIDHVMLNSKADVVCVVDIDCIPLNRDVIKDLAGWAYANESLCGPAATAASRDPEHVYVAPFFAFVSRKFWQRIQPLSAVANHRSDVMQEYTRAASVFDIKYRLVLPAAYQLPAYPQTWRCGVDGPHYGVGTTYEGGIYHLFRSRMDPRPELFLRQCEKVLAEKPV